MGCEEAASRRLILEKFKLRVAILGELPEISWQWPRFWFSSKKQNRWPNQGRTRITPPIRLKSISKYRCQDVSRALSITFADWQTQGRLEAGMYPPNYGINGMTVVNMYTEREYIGTFLI